jgi:hypothetical protein
MSTSAGRQKAKSKKTSATSRKAGATSRKAGATIQVWEDDPGSGVLASTGLPDPKRQPLGYQFPSPAPAPSGDSNSAAFRYWTAAEALRRGADFWAPKVATGQWQVGPVLPVLLDQGIDLNAYYDRQALNFFHGPSPTGTVYSGASPDILCHEMGHAILDSLKPQLWGAASQEAAAFHESFGDMSAILSALQLPSLRTAILRDTGAHFYSNSRLSRVAEQLGAAIRAQRPDSVDQDCLRNAVNSFSYSDPIDLPSRAPASQLSSEPHSFSRVFTGAFFQALAGLLRSHAADADAPTPDELLEVSKQMRDILVEGIIRAPVVSNFFSQVAAGMVEASSSISANYPAILKGAFVRRSILSLNSAMSIQSLQTALVSAGMSAPEIPPLDRVALSAFKYGLAEPLIVETPSHPRQFVAFAATEDAKSAEPRSAVSAASAFLDDLFAHGRVDYNNLGATDSMFSSGRRLKTHKVVREGGALHLTRRLFDCGLCHG